MAAPPSKAIKVLCLHGCCQDESMFRSLLKNWIRIGEKDHNLEFHFLQAELPHSDGGFTWFTSELDVSAIGTIEYSRALCNPCLERVHAYVVDHQIDVLLGFSQGGNVVDTYLWRYDMYGPVKRAMILSGYELAHTDPTPNNNGKHPPLAVPMLSIYSDADDVVSSKLRPTGYVELTEYAHSKGHRLPTGNKLIRAFCLYFETGVFEPPPPESVYI